MTEKPLITVLTPCYNTEKYMQRFIDCILAQTYDNIEIIFINDGSTDSTEEIIFNNKEKLENRGIKFQYVKQENCGVGGTINNGLKYVNGKYLTWPDYDDILYPNYLEKKVQLFEENPDVSVCFNPANVVDENDIDTVIGKYIRIEGDDSRIIEDYILTRNTLFAPVNTCIRTEDFWKINPTRDIYPSIEGQNWQILLPMLYHYKCGYVHESLAKYVERKDSHSRTHIKKFYKQKIGHLLIILNTLKTIKMPWKEKLYYYFLAVMRYTYILVRGFFVRVLFLRELKKMLKK